MCQKCKFTFSRSNLVSKRSKMSKTCKFGILDTRFYLEFVFTFSTCMTKISQLSIAFVTLWPPRLSWPSQGQIWASKMSKSRFFAHFVTLTPKFDLKKGQNLTNQVHSLLCLSNIFNLRHRSIKSDDLEKWHFQSPRSSRVKVTSKKGFLIWSSDTSN